MADTAIRLTNRRLVRLATLCMALILAAGWLSCAFAAETPAERLDLIRRVISEHGEYDTAEAQLNAFITENQGRPITAEALVLLGYCQDKQRKNADAVTSYSRVLTEHQDAPNPLKADAAIGAADASFRLNRFADAIRFYTNVLELTAKPEQTEAALLWRGEASYRLGLAEQDAGRDAQPRLLAAQEDFKTFIDSHPNSKNLNSALCGAGFASFDVGDYLRALYYFDRFIKEFPDDRRADECRYFMGESLYRLNRYDEAKVAFSAIYENNESSPYAADARAGVAWADYSLRRIAEAAQGFEAAAAMAGTDQERKLSFLYDAGCAWREAGELTKAAPPFQEVAKAQDHELNSLAWFRLGTLWQEQAKAARQRAESASNQAERERYDEIRKKLGEESIQYFRRALAGGKLGDEEIEARSLLGEVLLDAERLDEAARAFAEIAERWPDSTRAPWALYHEALAERGISQASADEAAQKAALTRAASALRKSLEYPDAKTRLQSAWALADYLNMLGDVEASREQYRWLAGDGLAWASAWRDPAGKADAALEVKAREYAADSLFRLGESYYFANDYPRATGFYEEINSRHADAPQSAMALLRLGEIAEAGKDNAAALARYEEALRAALRFGKNRVGTTIGYSQFRLGSLLLREGQRQTEEPERRRKLQEALRNLAAVVSDPPTGLNLGPPLYYLAEAKYSLGLKKEALADYENSIKADPQGDVADAAWFGLAWDKRDLGDIPGAIEAGEKVIRDFPASSVRPDTYVLV
ncbi:MAG: tetratricopeptide repeat protein, partial [Planctomycetes bacterium]|nr:tetratricopeptide repeat protein [Planctomycetota bacterium]